jgi:hypothetical protein
MSWTTRGTRAYQHRSVSRGRKVTSEYVRGSGVPAASAALIRRIEAERRAERAAARAAWLAERDELVGAERRAIE